MEALDSALAATGEGRLEEALDALLRAWRELPAPAIADVIDQISEVLTAREPPVRAVGPTSARKAWFETCEQGRAASVERLL